MPSNVVAIIQARMGSTRLPGKVLKRVLGKPLLQYQIERLSLCRKVHNIVIATTTKPSDDTIVELCRQLGVNVFRGSEEDVLKRYYEAALKYDADVVVRLTADCPLIDPEVVDNVVTFYLENQEHYDYVSNTLTRSYPRGMDTEVFSFKILKQVNELAYLPSHREHVTPFIYLNGDQYRTYNIHNQADQSHYRLTVDTIEDFELIKRIIEDLYPRNPYFKLKDIVEVLEANPEWVSINAHIEQKKI